ncbi:MAG: hypothetical protein AAFX92_09035 [Pseudomonadota bacterium]
MSTTRIGLSDHPGKVLLAVLGTAVGVSGTALAQDVPLSECFDAVGTYIAEKTVASADAGPSLISLTNGGQAFLVDANQAGVEDYAPFSDGLGAWRCVAADAGTIHIHATMMDFTFITADHPEQQIARLDYMIAYDRESELFQGTAELYFLALHSDPTDRDALPEPALTIDLNGVRVTAF